MKKIKIVTKQILSIFVDVYVNANGTKKKLSVKRIIGINVVYRLASWFNIFFSEDMRRLNGLRSAYKGKRCFIIGNGPSLNDLDLTLLKDEYTFGVNAIYTNYERMGFFPNFLVIEDVFVAEDRADELNALKSSHKFFGNYLSYCLENDDVSHRLNVEFNYGNHIDSPRFSRNSLRKIYVGGTVTYLCMQLAYFMGFTEVYLIGFDHSYKINKTVARASNTLISTVDDDPNHFSNSYFGKNKRWHDPNVERMERSYIVAKREFELDDRKIFNATAGGNLEVFERVTYSNLFK